MLSVMKDTRTVYNINQNYNKAKAIKIPAIQQSSIKEEDVHTDWFVAHRS